MKRIILDTNFLLAISQFRIDIFSELERVCNFPYDIYILDKTVGELDKILLTPGVKGKDAAKLALSIAKSKMKVIETGEGYVDDLLAGMADEDTIIATQDKGLKKRIKTMLITIRQKKYIVLDNT